MNWRFSFGCCLLLFLLVGTVWARTPAPDFPSAADPAVAWVPTILFVGNSFTHGAFQPVRGYNAGAVTDENFGLPRDDPRAENVEPGPFGGVPGIFKMLADEAGWPCEVHIEAVSAQTLAFHAQHAVPVLLSKPWDVVFLQDYSTGPLPVRRHGNPECFFAGATLLEQIVHARNPRARVFLYETWPRADLTYQPGRTYFGEGIEAMAGDLHAAYYQEADRDPLLAGVAPVGDAWVRAIRSGVAQANPYGPKEPGKVDLWNVDHYHPSIHGAYLAALVLFQHATRQDARQFGGSEHAARALGIPPAVAANLQRIACEQATSLTPPVETSIPISSLRHEN